MTKAIDREFTLDVLRELVGIDSVNPAFPADPSGRPGSGEAMIAEYARELFEDLGLETRVHESSSGRPSVIGVLRGTGGGRSLMLNGHIDTVGAGRMPAPFALRVEEGRAYGRGAYDMKGPLAACIGAVESIARSGRRPKGDVLLALVADEENESIGVQEVLEHHVTDGAIVAEPTQMELCLAHKGFVWLNVTTHGVAYHGSDYRRGVDANLRMIRALGPLADLQDRLLTEIGHPLVGPPSLHLGVLEGGEAPSIYANRCRGQIELRTIPGEGTPDLLEEVLGIVERARAEVPAEAIGVEEALSRAPFEALPGSAVAASVERAGAEALGARPQTSGIGFWTDAAFVRAKGIDTVVFGPSGAGAHADEEWVDLASVYDCAEVYRRVALDYCDT